MNVAVRISAIVTRRLLLLMWDVLTTGKPGIS